MSDHGSRLIMVNDVDELLAKVVYSSPNDGLLHCYHTQGIESYGKGFHSCYAIAYTLNSDSVLCLNTRIQASSINQPVFLEGNAAQVQVLVASSCVC